jgi:hypothetical protein
VSRTVRDDGDQRRWPGGGAGRAPVSPPPRSPWPPRLPSSASARALWRAVRALPLHAGAAARRWPVCRRSSRSPGSPWPCRRVKRPTPSLGPPLHRTFARIVARVAAALTAWDLFLDPQMVGEGYWTWERRGRYRDIPLSNLRRVVRHRASASWPHSRSHCRPRPTSTDPRTPIGVLDRRVLHVHGADGDGRLRRVLP